MSLPSRLCVYVRLFLLEVDLCLSYVDIYCRIGSYIDFCIPFLCLVFRSYILHAFVEI
jgi:hypothetical protein